MACYGQNDGQLWNKLLQATIFEKHILHEIAAKYNSHQKIIIPKMFVAMYKVVNSTIKGHIEIIRKGE